MEITRNVILDLLPLYISNEASDDSSALVEKYLESDPELADIAKRLTTKELPGETPIPLTWEDEMKAYRQAKRKLWERTILLAAITGASVLVIAVLAVIAWFFFKG